MLRFEFSMLACLLLLMAVQSERIENNCEKKEKSLISLDMAEDLISRAKYLFPNCTDAATNISECGAKEKASAYLDMAKKLISEVKENFPTCIVNNTIDPNIEDPVTKEPEIEKPATEELVTEVPETEEYPRDCSGLLQYGQNMSGVYTIWPSSSLFPNRSLEVFCDMETDGGGWTVVQRRGDFEPQEDFYRDWNDYKFGFGNITQDFWLGNDNLFVLSNQRKCKIRFELESVDKQKAYALYETFYIENEESNYKLHIEDYSGNAGDSMEYHNLMEFSTNDRDNDNTSSTFCARSSSGAWWYNRCLHCNPNGLYRPGVRSNFNYESVFWNTWLRNVGLAAMEIKLKRC